MEERFFDLFNESLKVISSYCPVCNSKYNPIEARILEDRNDLHLIHIRCRHCFSAIVALVMVSNLGVNSIGMITDLSSEEVLKFKQAKPIGHDDVIDIHQSLKAGRALIDNLI